MEKKNFDNRPVVVEQSKQEEHPWDGLDVSEVLWLMFGCGIVLGVLTLILGTA
jgi:hypothetical protein